MTSNQQYLDHTFVFGAEQGLELAIAFTAYDNSREIILDKSIGELVFIAYEWGENVDTGDVFVKRTRIPSYPCSRDELGIGEENENRRFYPIYPWQENQLEKFHKKFRCIKREDMRIYGDWNSK